MLKKRRLRCPSDGETFRVRGEHQEIADKLFLSKRTIDIHRQNLLLKMEVKNSAALVKKAMQLGLLNQ